MMAATKDPEKTDAPRPVDTFVGSKVKSRRLLMGMSQEALAQKIGLTFQQVQKYERGTNRISVSRLFDISKALQVSIDYFIDGLDANDRRGFKGVSDNKQAAFEHDSLMKRDVQELIRAYESIKDPKIRKQVLEMAKTLSRNDE